MSSAAVILRKWTGRIRTAQQDEYVDYIAGTGLEDYAKTPGNVGTYMLRRDTEETTEYLMFTLWESVEAIKAFHTGVSEDFLLKQDQFQELRDRGVTFEEFDLPGLRTVDGIAEVEGPRCAGCRCSRRGPR